jgi:hypothetical protein
MESLTDVRTHIQKMSGRMPATVATCAKLYEGSIRYPELRQRLLAGKPYVLLMGTAWGLSAEFIMAADHILEPVKGAAGYNHLSVRSAASIILDRLLGRQQVG